jgi:Lon-like ATP-dependent protease
LELEEVGTVLQVINLTSYPNISGGQVVVMPHKRIRRTRVVSAPSPNVALAAVAVEYIEEPNVEALETKERSASEALEERAQLKERPLSSASGTEKDASGGAASGGEKGSDALEATVTTSASEGPSPSGETSGAPSEMAGEVESGGDGGMQEVAEAEAEEMKKLHEEISKKLQELLSLSLDHKEQYEQVIRFYDLNNSLKLADLVAGMSLAHSPAQRRELQSVLEEKSLKERLKKVLGIVKRDLEFVQLQSSVKTEVEEKVTKDQRRIMLMEQMKHIMKELGIEKDDKEALVEQFQEALKEKTVPEEASKVIESELTKLGTLEPSSSEFNVCRTYLEWLTCLPWGTYTEESKDIRKAQSILDEDHYGLEDVKERILEHIAVGFLKQSVQGKIMCMVGPPGTGKTSVGKSIARALDRKFFRFSVGGLHDVAELRGHRRTYVGAMPGKLIQCLKLTQSSNPVVLIDEIDKLGSGYRGDPSSALLEILDPEQNSTFRDHYLDVPTDLSRVLFVCTANSIETIPGPLLDRMEVIRIAGYVFDEKMAIAKQYLLPQIIEQSGLKSTTLGLEEATLRKMVLEYAREAGVRQLHQLIEKVGRKVALGVVRKQKASEEEHTVTIDPDGLSKYIGQPLHQSDRLYDKGTPPGVITGLAWTAMGGASLVVEARGYLQRNAAAIPDDGGSQPGRQSSAAGSGGEGDSSTNTAEKQASKGESNGWSMAGTMKVTGQLGSVMSESSQISHTYARLFARELDPINSFLDEAHVHLHVPEGAIPKDGPSAGVTMTTALLSLVLNKAAHPDLAMTGELTLTGKVLKVGGIKEKVIAARREGMTTLLLPRQNEADYLELKEYVRAGLTAHFIEHFDDIYRLAFDEVEIPALPGPSRGLPVITVSTPPEAAATAPSCSIPTESESGDVTTIPAQACALSLELRSPTSSKPTAV